MATTRRAAADRSATIHDIAALCGVAAASTVSRALSTPDRVDIRTRQRIQAAAAELHYIPNSQARALSSGRTGAVGVLVPDITNPFYFDLIRGTQLQLKAAGDTQLLVDTEESDEVEASTVEQLRKSADEIIVAASRLSDDALLGAAAKTPLVTVNRDVPGVPAVLIDTPSATSQALDHLVSLGHTRIAYMAGPASSQSSARRWTALSEAAAERGAEVLRLGPFAPKTQSGAAAADAAVRSGVTAGIVFNDLIAIGMLQRLRERGIGVPQHEHCWLRRYFWHRPLQPAADHDGITDRTGRPGGRVHAAGPAEPAGRRRDPQPVHDAHASHRPRLHGTGSTP